MRHYPKAHNLEAEPPVGSVILVDGAKGTAWQRLGRDGLWHSVIAKTGEGQTWPVLAELSKQRVKAGESPTLVVYQAPAEA